MIAEAAAAFALAQGAVNGIKKGIQLGRDINDLTKQVMAFFDAKDVIQKAANEERQKGGKSVESEAMENVMRAKAMADFEAELNRIFVLTNNAELWNMMLAERSRIRAERKSAEIAAEKKRRKVAAKRQEIAEWTVIGIVVVAVVGAAVWGLIELIIWKAAQ
jgi:hypothetical protein